MLILIYKNIKIYNENVLNFKTVFFIVAIEL